MLAVTMGLRCTMLLPLLFVLYYAVAKGSREAVAPGRWTPIPNIKAPCVTKIVNFAVAEYDKRNRVKLKLVNVVKGEMQVVAGMNYRLVLATKEGSSSVTRDYKAVVWERGITKPLFGKSYGLISRISHRLKPFKGRS